MSETKRCHRLKSLSVVGGFLDGMNIEFADGLNCLIGHRGTGKTTVLEFIRYALDEFPRDDGGQTRKRVEALVRSNLGDGRIRLASGTSDGLEYIVDRTASGEPMVLTADGQPTDCDQPRRRHLQRRHLQPERGREHRRQSAVAAGADRQVRGRRDRRHQPEGRRPASQAGCEHQRHRHPRPAAQWPGQRGRRASVHRIEDQVAGRGRERQTDGEADIAQQHRALRGRETQAIKEAGELIRKYSEWLHESRGQFTRAIETAFDESMFDGPNGKLMGRIHQTLEKLGGKLDRAFDQAAGDLDSGGVDLADLAGKLQEAHQVQELAFRDLIAKHNHARGIATERADLEKKRNDVLAKDRRKAELQRKLDKLYARPFGNRRPAPEALERAVRGAAAGGQLDQRGGDLPHPRADRPVR